MRRLQYHREQRAAAHPFLRESRLQQRSEDDREQTTCCGARLPRLESGEYVGAGSGPGDRDGRG